MPYNDILQELRKNRGITQKELANKFLTTQRTISNWESGRNEPPYEMLIKYAKEFDVSIDYILGLTKEEKPHYRIGKQVNINGNNINNINVN